MIFDKIPYFKDNIDLVYYDNKIYLNVNDEEFYAIINIFNIFEEKIYDLSQFSDV